MAQGLASVGEVRMGDIVTRQIKKRSLALGKWAGQEVRKHPVVAVASAVAAMGLIGYAIRQAGRSFLRPRKLC